jgi:hypothetical protein
MNAAATATAPNAPTEWKNVFMGAYATPVDFSVPASANLSRAYGRYGPLRLPLGIPFFGGTSPRGWAPVDFNGTQDPYNLLNTNSIGATPGTILPVAGQAYTYASFPVWGGGPPSAGYGNGYPTETTYDGTATGTAMHPLLYNAQLPVGGNRLIPVSGMHELLRLGGTNAESLTSDLFRLCPNNLISDANSAQRRRQVTLLSAAMDRIHGTPYIDDVKTTPPPYAASQYGLPAAYSGGSWTPLTGTPQPQISYPTRPFSGAPGDFDATQPLPERLPHPRLGHGDV